MTLEVFPGRPQLGPAGAIIDGDHLLATLAVMTAIHHHTCHEGGHGGVFVLGGQKRPADVAEGLGEGSKLATVGVHGVGGQEQPQGVELALEPGVMILLGDMDQPMFRCDLLSVTEQADLLLAGLLGTGHAHGLIQAGQQARPVGCQAIQGAGTDHHLQHSSVELAQVTAPTQIGEIPKWPVTLTLCHQMLGAGLAQTLDATETIAHRLGPLGSKVKQGMVDMGAMDSELHGPGLGHHRGHVVHLMHFRRQIGGHEGGRAVGLEIGGLVGDQRVGRRMGLVEAVAGELFHQVEDLGGPSGVHPLGHRAMDELGAQLDHLLGLLLAHGATQQVCLPQAEAGQRLGNLHHLLLVDDDAIGGLQDGGQRRVGIDDGGETMTAGDEVVHHAGLQRPGAVERHQGNDVLEALRGQAHQQLAHAVGFQLEDAQRPSGAQQLIGGLVVLGDRLEVHGCKPLDGTQLVGSGDGVLDDGQRLQAQKVELDQAHRF